MREWNGVVPTGLLLSLWLAGVLAASLAAYFYWLHLREWTLRQAARRAPAAVPATMPAPAAEGPTSLIESDPVPEPEPAIPASFLAAPPADSLAEPVAQPLAGPLAQPLATSAAFPSPSPRASRRTASSP